MKYLLIALSFLLFTLRAQGGEVFVVKKKTHQFVPGFYCSDYMTDGRICFYFDKAGKVHVFNSDKAPEKVPAAYAQNPRVLYTTDYAVNADTVTFISVLYLTPGDFNPVSGKQTTTVTGQYKDDKIRMLSVTDVNGRATTRKEIFVRRVEN